MPSPGLVCSSVGGRGHGPSPCSGRSSGRVNTGMPLACCSAKSKYSAFSCSWLVVPCRVTQLTVACTIRSVRPNTHLRLRPHCCTPNGNSLKSLSVSVSSISPVTPSALHTRERPTYSGPRAYSGRVGERVGGECSRGPVVTTALSRGEWECSTVYNCLQRYVSRCVYVYCARSTSQEVSAWL
jgi:hypothetical protein